LKQFNFQIKTPQGDSMLFVMHIGGKDDVFFVVGFEPNYVYYSLTKCALKQFYFEIKTLHFDS
jgi:hypothetical protein